MRKYAVLLCVALLCVGTHYVAAQSRRAPAGATGKSNQRPDPQPTPTPDPQTTANTGDDKNAAPVVDDGEVLRVDTNLVTIPVKVSDRKNRFIGGLKKEDFKVFEDDVEQDIELFSNEEQPFTVALVLDMSYSTKFKIDEIQSAAIAFIDQLRPQDKLMVISFDEEVHMLCEATNDRQRIYRAIKSTRIGTGTSLYDAVDMVMNNRLKQITGRKAIVLFTDGVDTTSRRSHDMRNLSDAMELDALIYPVRYDTYADVQAMNNGQTVTKIPIPGGGGTVTTGRGNPGGIPPSTSGPVPGMPDPANLPRQGPSNSRGTSQEEYQRAEKYLKDLAVYTGGRDYLADTMGNLNDAFTRIASELREFYSLGYYPKEEGGTGKKKKIKVKLANQTGLVVRSRDSYVVGRKEKKTR
jgi:Ca-activated chloride channel homolog